jgi:hypothetical protein
MAASRDSSKSSFLSTPTPSGRSSRSQSRDFSFSPLSPLAINFSDNNTCPSLFPTSPFPDESQKSNDAFWNQGPPPYVEPEPPKPITIAIKKKNEKKEENPPSPQTNVGQLVQEYTTLMMTKKQMDSRRFNKLAFALLDKCIHVFKSTESPIDSLKEPTFSKYREDAKEAFGEFRLLLLNAKEMHSETLVQRVVSFIDKGLLPSLTADERKEELQKKSLAFITELSPSMSIKIAPIIKSYISRQFGSDLEDLLAEVRLPEMSAKDKTLVYSRMFSNFMDDPRCVFFAATNKQLLGALEPVDVWFLTFFAFVTVRRSRGDNLLMLGLVGGSFLSFSKDIKIGNICSPLNIFPFS